MPVQSRLTMKFKISDDLYLSRSKGRGLGVFTKSDISAKRVVEKSCVLVFPPEERKLLEKTGLHNYIFEWEDDNKSCCVALGYLSMYNHSFKSNCEYIMDFEKKTMVIKTVRAIKAGEELTINYNGEWDNENELWFDVL